MRLAAIAKQSSPAFVALLLTVLAHYQAKGIAWLLAELPVRADASAITSSRVGPPVTLALRVR